MNRKPTHEIPLSSAEAWAGVWFRARSGPTTKGVTVHVDRWHRVESIEGDRINTVCRPAWRKPWPGGGLRMEIARPDDWTTLPGDLCPKCGRAPFAVERETPVGMVDDIVEMVLERLKAQA